MGIIVKSGFQGSKKHFCIYKSSRIYITGRRFSAERGMYGNKSDQRQQTNFGMGMRLNAKKDTSSFARYQGLS